MYHMVISRDLVDFRTVTKIGIIGTRKMIGMEITMLLVPKGTMHLTLREGTMFSDETRTINIEPAINGIEIERMSHIITRIEICYFLSITVWWKINGNAVTCRVISRMTIVHFQQ